MMITSPRPAEAGTGWRRRSFLGLLGSVGAAVGLGGCAGSSSPRADVPQRTWRAENRVGIPPELAAEPGRIQRFELVLQTGQHEFLPGRPTPTWGVNGGYLGPTLRMRKGAPVALTVRNDLPEPTTLHWHGMRLPATMDGGPHQVIAPGATWRPEWTVVNDASTTWYHPHPHGATASHVFRGVAGMLIIDDPDPVSGLPSDYGVDDIPCIIQDRSIDVDGQPVFDTEPNFGQMGTDLLVNGTMNAYLPVTRQRVRLRILNASNARLYHLGFDDQREFDLIATDAGLLPTAVRVRQVSVGPAERVEVVVALEPTQRCTLISSEGDERIDAGTFPIMELRAADQLDRSPALPTELGGAADVVAPSGARVRHFRLQGHDAINGQGMDLTRVDEVVPAGAVEVWEVENTVYSHNFHIHGVEFSVIDKNGAAPSAAERGRKDTVHVREKSMVRLAVQFADFVDPTSPYMYHCHILRHEDDGMMGQFVVVEPGTEDATPRTVPGPASPHGSGHHS